VTAVTPGRASWTTRALILEGSPDDPDDYAEITSRWERWLDDDQREAEEAGAGSAIETAESHSAIYLNEIDRLATALRAIRDAHAPGEPGFDIASRTLDDAARAISIHPAPRTAGGQLRTVEALHGLVRDMLQDMPDTADEPEWRNRAGALHVRDPYGKPYRALTEEDI
jgi:hypothetical protein